MQLSVQASCDHRVACSDTVDDGHWPRLQTMRRRAFPADYAVGGERDDDDPCGGQFGRLRSDVFGFAAASERFLGVPAAYERDVDALRQRQESFPRLGFGPQQPAVVDVEADGDPAFPRTGHGELHDRRGVLRQWNRHAAGMVMPGVEQVVPVDFIDGQPRETRMLAIIVYLYGLGRVGVFDIIIPNPLLNDSSNK